MTVRRCAHAYAGCTCPTHQPVAEAEQNRREHALTEKAYSDPHDNTSSGTHARAYRPRHDSQPIAPALIRACRIGSPGSAEPGHVIHRPDEHADATPNTRRTP